LFDRPKPTTGCSANGRRKRRRLFKVGYKSLSSCGNKLLKLWPYTVTAEQDILLPYWAGRSHISGGFNSWWPTELLISHLYFSHMKHANVKTHNLDAGFQKSLQFMNFLCMTLKFRSLVQYCAKNPGGWYCFEEAVNSTCYM